MFESAPCKVTLGHWCGQCSIKWKHCGKDCVYCFNRSFASYKGVTTTGRRRVDCLVNKDVLRWAISSNTKVQFKCDVCDHMFESALCKVTQGRWCGQCSIKWKHCGKDCIYCFNRSFASYKGVTTNGILKVDCLVNKDVLRWAISSDTKAQFKCDVCDHTFESALSNVTNGHWCPLCKNKTELKVYNFLSNEFKIKKEYRPAKRYKHMVQCRFDFLLKDFGKIFEIDGPQHTEEVSKGWIKSTLFHRQIRDKWKEFIARRENKRVYRFDQRAIWLDSYDWKSEMRNIIYNYNK